MPNHCIQLTADKRAFNVFSLSFSEVIYNHRHQAAATDAGRYANYMIGEYSFDFHVAILFFTGANFKCRQII